MPVAIVPDITLSMEIRIDKMKKAKGHIKRRKQIVKALSVKSSQVKSSQVATNMFWISELRPASTFSDDRFVSGYRICSGCLMTKLFLSNFCENLWKKSKTNKKTFLLNFPPTICALFNLSTFYNHIYRGRQDQKSIHKSNNKLVLKLPSHWVS